MNKELLAIFNYFEKDKGFPTSSVLKILEESLLLVAKKFLGQNENFLVSINPKNAEIDLFVEKEVVEEGEKKEGTIPLSIAQELSPECSVGQFLDVPISIESLGRIAAQKVRQMVMQKFSDLEREIVCKKYESQVGKLVSGVIKRSIHGKHFFVDLGKIEGILYANRYPPTEHFKEGETIQALLLEMREGYSGVELILSRSSSEFVRLLLSREVPEIVEGNILIKQVVREPGLRTKIVVSSKEENLDAAGACIGVRGSRIKNVLRELGGEKIDVIVERSNFEEFLRVLFHPIFILSFYEEEKKLFLVVEDKDLAIALGKRKVNLRLNAKLLERELIIWKKSEYQQYIEKQINFLQSAPLTWLDKRITKDQLEKMEFFSLFTREIIKDLLQVGYTTWRIILHTEASILSENSKCEKLHISQLLEEVVRKYKHLENYFSLTDREK